jgi:hypothetical protein
MACSSRHAGERHLCTQLDVQRRTMLRRGVDPAVVEEHIGALEYAIRAEFGRHVITRGGAA